MRLQVRALTDDDNCELVQTRRITIHSSGAFRSVCVGKTGKTVAAQRELLLHVVEFTLLQGVQVTVGAEVTGSTSYR